MDSVHFLNLEYFILLAYQVFTGVRDQSGVTTVDVSQIPDQTLHLLTYIAWTGLALTVLLAVGIVVVFRRMEHTIHEGWHHRDQEIEAMHHRPEAAAPLNRDWEHVLTLIGSPEETNWRRAIMEADIMLGNMLAARGFRGQTIGDMLKDANPIQFRTLDLAWKAHKVRNQIAHQGINFTLTERDARATVDYYRQVFEEFDYL
jgi:hypothetical protein